MASAEIQLAYQVCPIFLSGGIATQSPNGTLPILSLLYPGGTAQELPFDIGGINGLDDAFAAFNVLPGGTLIAQTIGKYPMANQWVAANALINEPLTISVIMDTPMRGPDAWTIKKSVFSALQAALLQHNNLGGMYTVVTPAFNYDNLVLLALTDNSRGNNSLPQNAWRFDFERPLITTEGASLAYNAVMQKIGLQVVTDGRVSGPQPGQTSAQPDQGRSITTVGYTIGGSARLIDNSGMNLNYPAMKPNAALPYRGIS